MSTTDNAIIWLTLLISGGLEGLARVCEFLGTISQLHPSISSCYGYTAIIAAFIGRSTDTAYSFIQVINGTFGRRRSISANKLVLILALAGIFQGILFFKQQN